MTTVPITMPVMIARHMELPITYEASSLSPLPLAIDDSGAHVHIKDSFKSADGAEHYTYPGDGHGDVLRIVRDLENNGYTGFYSMEPLMAVVFHNSSIHATEEDRSSNFYEYGKRFMKLTDSIA